MPGGMMPPPPPGGAGVVGGGPGGASGGDAVPNASLTDAATLLLTEGLTVKDLWPPPTTHDARPD